MIGVEIALWLVLGIGLALQLAWPWTMSTWGAQVARRIETILPAGSGRWIFGLFIVGVAGWLVGPAAAVALGLMPPGWAYAALVALAGYGAGLGAWLPVRLDGDDELGPYEDVERAIVVALPIGLGVLAMILVWIAATFILGG